MQLAKAVANAAAALVLKAKNVAQRAEDSALQNRVIAAATQCALSTSQLVACTRVRLPPPWPLPPKGGSLVRCTRVGERMSVLHFYQLPNSHLHGIRVNGFRTFILFNVIITLIVFTGKRNLRRFIC